MARGTSEGTDVDVHGAGEQGSEQRAGYRRSAGSPRGEARRQDLLERVTDDLAVNGLVDFSLRRAAKAAGTTHKVLLYYFEGPEELLAHAIPRLRERRIEKGLAAATQGPAARPLAARVSAMWPILVGEEDRVLGQAIGLAMYDPDRYGALGRDASKQYLPTLFAICPEHWADRRKLAVAHMILAVLRGFLMEARTSGESDGVDAGFEALIRALEREEAAPA